MSRKSPDLTDWIQERVIARTKERGLTAYAIAQMTGGKVSHDHVKDFLERRKSMGSHKLQHILLALEIDLAAKR